jgi:glutamate-1-semialdehyde 2,1-aminomutase
MTLAEQTRAEARTQNTPADVLDYERTYVERRAGSRRLYREATGVFPSGVTHDNRFLQPFPIYCTHGQGARKWDVDGNEYVDYVGGHGALLLGHAHPDVVRAVQEQMPRGTHLGAGHELEVRWGQLVQRLVPSAERVKFTASGTEATHLAIRLARSFTQKTRVVKFEGHFHGWHDYATAAVDPPYDVPTSSGVPAEALATMRVLPADPAAVEQALAAGDVAAVILEPTGGAWGTLPVDEAFCRELRRLTQAHGALLIFDEVITGFRCSPGGAQAAYGITPDLTTMAKILAGGLPGGGVAGRADVMSILEFDAERPGWNRGGRIAHPGTFNGNPLSAAAGIACLEVVARGEVHRHVNALAEQLRRGMNEAARPFGLDGCTYGTFSMFHVSLDRSLLDASGGPRRYAKSKSAADAKLRRAMLVQGIDLMGTGGMLSLAHTAADVEKTVTAFGHALAALAHEGVL